ncbi:MAG: HD domain-containing protein [Christensenellales bacterium]|jgi:putative hydrolase of HD superfamily
MRKRLEQQIDFFLELDRLKQVLRRNLIIGEERNENDAEHSWHLAVMALVFSEYAAQKEMDLLRVVKMLLLHDVVEIDAGDTFCYDEAANRDKEEREEMAARRIFALLPPDQHREFYGLWREFEEGKTKEARFAVCLDRLQPLFLNYRTGGHTWSMPGVTSGDVKKRNRPLEENAPVLWEYALEMIERAVEEGILAP